MPVFKLWNVLYIHTCEATAAIEVELVTPRNAVLPPSVFLSPRSQCPAVTRFTCIFRMLIKWNGRASAPLHSAEVFKLFTRVLVA